MDEYNVYLFLSLCGKTTNPKMWTNAQSNSINSMAVFLIRFDNSHTKMENDLKRMLFVLNSIHTRSEFRSIHTHTHTLISSTRECGQCFCCFHLLSSSVFFFFSIYSQLKHIDFSLFSLFRSHSGEMEYNGPMGYSVLAYRALLHHVCNIIKNIEKR